MAAVARVPLRDITNLPEPVRKQAPKRLVRTAPSFRGSRSHRYLQNFFNDKENIDPLSVEGFLLFKLASCPKCKGLFPADGSAPHVCATATQCCAYGQNPNAANQRIKKPNLRNM